MKTQSIRIDHLDLDPDYYVRKPGISEPDWPTIERYADAMRCGQVFPPIYVVPRNGSFVVLDGWTRTHACKKFLRGQGTDSDSYRIPCAVDPDLPEKEWYGKAAELNCRHGRPLSMQERIAIADRLRQQNWAFKKISDLLAIPIPRIKGELGERVVVDEKTGERIILKSAVKHLGGTTRERIAAAHGGPIHSANILAAIDNLIAMIRSGIANPSDPVEREKMEALYKLLGGQLKKR